MNRIFDMQRQIAGDRKAGRDNPVGASVRFIALCLSSVVSVFFVMASATAQTTVELPAPKDDVEEARFISDIEARLRRDIESYLGNNRFIVQVDATLSRTRTVVKTSANTRPNLPDIAARPLPQAPQVSQVSVPDLTELGADTDAEAFEPLPGLPIDELPVLKENNEKLKRLSSQIKQLAQERQQILQYADQLKQRAQEQSAAPAAGADTEPQETTVGYRNVIKRLAITLVIDESLKDEQTEFLKNLVTRKAQLNELRGDTLSLVRTQFSHLEPATPDSLWLAYQPWWWLAGLLAVGLVLLLLMALVVRRMSGARQGHGLSEYSTGVPGHADSGVQSGRFQGSAAPTKNEFRDSDAATLKFRINESRQRLVSQGLSQPHRFQQAVSQALGSAQAFEVAALSATMGKSLFASLATQLTPDHWNQIDALLKEGNWDEAQLFEGMEQFSQRLEKQQDDASNTQPFAFLNKLNDSQVLYLIKDEDIRIKALVMSQLPAQRSADIILRLDEKELAQIAFEIEQFQSLPVSAFKDIADRLAKASLTVPSFENISADGLSVLINMLDKMSVSEETRMLKTLKSEKPETYYRLRQVYFTFADLMRTPERIISNELRAVSVAELSQALCNTSIEFKRHVLAALPMKLRAGVIQELKANESQARSEEIHEARRGLVNTMRDVIRAGRFSMTELVEPKAAQ